LYLLSNDIFGEFIKNLIIINTILIPLLINVLMILYYSIERTKSTPDSKEKTTKITYLRHLHLTLTMSILVSTILLIVSVLLDATKINYQQYHSYYQFFSYQIADIWPIKLLVFFLVGFLFINILIVIKRIYLLINYEINDE
jgi:sterol desaturase/sphingolipid hydroxylase (fatty acid hydroxylase superfamily)